jgi:3-oxoacyl-[acyl-carrier protein] reductase
MKKTVLITGGNKGIGLETTKAFVTLGYEVIVVARDFSDFIEHESVQQVVFDLTKVDEIPALIASLPPIDILINNAGVMYSIPYQSYSPEKIDSMMKLNLYTPIKLIEEVVKRMPHGGRIVNNASIAGQIGHPDIWYGMSKAALINATKSFSKIFEGKIIINAVASSTAETEMRNVVPKDRQEAFLKSVITKRFAYPEEIAKTMVWLATESPEYINGSVIDINNGSFPR